MRLTRNYEFARHISNSSDKLSLVTFRDFRCSYHFTNIPRDIENKYFPNPFTRTSILYSSADNNFYSRYISESLISYLHNLKVEITNIMKSVNIVMIIMFFFFFNSLIYSHCFSEIGHANSYRLRRVKH